MIVEGKKIGLRDWVMADLPVYQGWLANDHEWKQFDGPYFLMDESKVPERIGRLRDAITAAEWSNPRHRLVIADRATDAFVGMVSRYWESEETNWLSVGIAIYDPAHWSRGIGFEALGLWSDYVLRTMPELVRVGLATWSGNERMMHLADKLGFMQEARFRLARIVRGNYYDSMGYGVLRTEWEALYPHGFAACLHDGNGRSLLHRFV
jgi:putative hydrolase of HD superfamily